MFLIYLAACPCTHHVDGPQHIWPVESKVCSYIFRQLDMRANRVLQPLEIFYF